MLGADDCAVLSLEDQLERVETRLENCVNQLTKAILESALGELGNFGALRVDEFWHTFKAASQEIFVKQRADMTTRGAMPSIDLPSVEVDSQGTTPGCGGSGTGSYVPTVFGGPASVTAVDEPAVGTSAITKPGKDFQDHI